MKQDILAYVETFAKENKISRSKLTAFAESILSLSTPQRSGKKACQRTMEHREAIQAWTQANKGKEFTTQDVANAVGCHLAEANNGLKKLTNVQVVGRIQDTGKRGRKPQLFKAF